MIRDPFAPKLIQRGLRPIAELAAARPHGDRLRYMAGCHCFKCRRANSDYERWRIAARAAGDWNGIVDAAPARAHLLKLSRAGVGQWAVCHATDVARSMLHEIKNGDRPRIRARTLRRILAVTPKHRADHSIVPAARLWRLINQLLAEGYTKSALARKLGYKTRAIQFRRHRVLARSVQRVVALHSRLTI
jgi:hypothetical protein